jgi:hypothetical protein
MKIEIEVKEFGSDESEFETSFRNYVVTKTKDIIWKEIEEKINAEISKTVKIQVEKQISKKTELIIQDIIDNDTLLSPYTNVRVKVKEYIRLKFEKDSGWQSPNKVLEDIAKKFGAELKSRYDLMFATQIVKSLDKEGLLKDNVAKMILENNQKP